MRFVTGSVVLDAAAAVVCLPSRRAGYGRAMRSVKLRFALFAAAAATVLSACGFGGPPMF